jgi:hypothetical protein
MSLGINFLHERQKHLTKSQQTDRRVLKWTVRGVGVLFLITIVVLGVTLWYQNRLKGVLALQDQTRQSILSNQEIEKEFVIGFQKLKILSKLFVDRADKQAAIDYFTTVFGPQVLVKQIEYGGDEKLLTFRLEANDVFVLESVFTQLKSPQTTEGFTQVTPTDLRRTGKGTYQMTVAVVL